MSFILVTLMALGYGYFSSLDHSGTMPILGALVGGFFASILAMGIYVKFHRNPQNISLGITFLIVFTVFFILGLL